MRECKFQDKKAYLASQDFTFSNWSKMVLHFPTEIPSFRPKKKKNILEYSNQEATGDVKVQKRFLITKNAYDSV